MANDSEELKTFLYVLVAIVVIAWRLIRAAARKGKATAWVPPPESLSEPSSEPSLFRRSAAPAAKPAAVVPAPAAAPPPVAASEPVESGGKTGEQVLALLREQAASAVLLQEILSPPKALR